MPGAIFLAISSVITAGAAIVAIKVIQGITVRLEQRAANRNAPAA